MMQNNYPQDIDKDLYLLFSIKYSKMELVLIHSSYFILYIKFAQTWKTNNINTQEELKDALDLQNLIITNESLKSELDLYSKSIYNRIIKLYNEKDYLTTLEYIKIVLTTSITLHLINILDLIY